MTAFLLSLALKFWPVIAAVAGGLWWGIRQRRAGAAAVRAEQAMRDAQAREERHEMDREATDAEKQARDLTDAAAREEALKWRKS